MADADTPTLAEHLDPSELGTKEYWDSLYAGELENHSNNPEDVGTVWFSDAGAEERVLNFLEDLSDEGILDKGAEGSGSSFIDIGTGNGHFLWEMRDQEWEGALVGVDYSDGSISLARKAGVGSRRGDGDAAADEQQDEEETTPPRFEVWDVMTQKPDPSWFPENGFDVVLDKGTFDAISLSEKVDGQGRREFEGYREKVEKLVKPGSGRVIVTSCNWTSDELRHWFESDSSELVFEKAVKYPSFKFGGKEGQRVCTLCFKRKEAR